MLYQLEKYRQAKRAELGEKEEKLKVHASKAGEILEHVDELGRVDGVGELEGVEVGMFQRELREAIEGNGWNGLHEGIEMLEKELADDTKVIGAVKGSVAAWGHGVVC